MCFDDGIAFRIERHWPDGCPVARIAGPAARVVFAGLALQATYDFDRKVEIDRFVLQSAPAIGTALLPTVSI